MIGRQNPQANFFDQEIFSRMIPEDHPLVLIKKHVDFSFVNEEAARHYHPERGRPSFPPEVLFRILFLEVWANLSDLQVCRELRYNVLYRWFCGLGWEDEVPDDTTLVVFRRRLGEEGFRRLFERVVRQAKEKGLLRGKWAIVDGTKVAAHAAVKNHLSLVREGRKRLLRVLAKYDEQAVRELESLAEPERDADYADHEQLLAAEILKGRELLHRLAEYQQQDLAELKELYRKAVELQGVASFSDPDARWGFKKKGEPFLGYKAHVTCDETGMVTAVDVTPGNEAELPQGKGLVTQLKQQDLKPKYFAADKAFDDAAFRAELAQEDIRAYIPWRQDLKRLSRQGFAYDPKTGVVTCPAGKQATGRSPHREGGYLYYFSERGCAACALKGSCLTKSQKRKVIYLKPEVLRHRPRGVKRAMRIRKTIERLFGEVKTWHRMDRARYRGLGRVTIQVLLTFLVANAKKMAARLAARGSLSACGT